MVGDGRVEINLKPPDGLISKGFNWRSMLLSSALNLNPKVLADPNPETKAQCPQSRNRNTTHGESAAELNFVYPGTL